MKQYLVVDKDGNQQGPMDEQTLLEQYKAGVYHADTPIWIVGFSEQWMNLGAVLNLSPGKGEEFFPTSHPIWTCFLLFALPILCLYVCCSTEDRETLLCMGSIWGEIAALLGFYLACWWLAGDNKSCIKGLATHAILLSAVSLLACAPYSVIYAVNNISSDDVMLAHEMLASMIIMSAYYFIPRKLYGFSVGRSWAVIGIMLLICIPLICILWGMFPGTL